MSQDQLFDAGGAVRTNGRSRQSLSRENRRKELRKRELRQRLVGDGPVRTDPKTGRRWDTRTGSVKLAYTWTCPECGVVFEACIKIHREADGRCVLCRADQRRSAVGETRPGGHGYVLVKVAQPSEWKLEHRHRMELMLGRALHPTESVHHINGDRADNRPDNLQLRRGAHGPGQAWCCAECGSSNIVAIPIEDVDDTPPLGGRGAR